jgi:CRP/FNR family transcriptional regulator, cyclic AMP receptor protein
VVAETGEHPARLEQLEFTDDDAQILALSPLLRELSEEDAATFRPYTHVVLLPRGERLFVEGDLGDCLYLVISGKVKLTRTAPDGRESLVSVHGPGEMFGELAMFDPTFRTSTAVAVTDARLAEIDHDDLRQVLTTRPAVSLLLLKALAQRLRRVTETNTNLIFTDVPGRVAKALLELAGKFGTPGEDGIQVNHDLTQEELAQLVGASRETVNKALADFATRGWIQLSAKSVLLIDPDRLKRRARLTALRRQPGQAMPAGSSSRLAR